MDQLTQINNWMMSPYVIGTMIVLASIVVIPWILLVVNSLTMFEGQ